VIRARRARRASPHRTGGGEQLSSPPVCISPRAAILLHAMTAPSARPRPPLQPLVGSAWLAARLTLAVRRARRFTRWWLAIGGTATVVALMLPVAATVPAASTPAAALEQQTADTLATAAARDSARRELATADSVLADARALLARPG